MKSNKLVGAVAATVCVLVMQASLSAQVFFTENFDYADGDLVTVSGAEWATHSGAAPDIQVVGQQAVIASPGSMDDNRLTGQIAGVNDIWYYAVVFSVEILEDTVVNNDYFIHFKDDSTFGFNARLALDDPSAGGDYSVSIWASSEGDGQADWMGDFSFGETLTAVVRWNNGTGEATLWINPVNEASTSITDDEVADAMRAVESVSLRQDGAFAGGSSTVTIDAISAGTDFDAVLAAVSSNEVLLGDVNLDGVVDLLDVAPFVDRITTGTFQEEADVNQDGMVDLLDVAPFVALLTGG